MSEQAISEATVTDYFEDFFKKPAISAAKEGSDLEDTPRTDLLLDQYKRTQERLATESTLGYIDLMYKEWCDLLILGHNIVAHGPQSKFALLETFKRRYLDSGRLPDWRSSELKKPPMLNITTVRLHGLEPIKTEQFNHAIFGVKETRRIRDSDFSAFKRRLAEENMHYVFLVHSLDYLMRDCEDLWEIISRLYREESRFVHLVASTDSWNAGKKTMNLKYTLRFVFFQTPLPESYFWEKASMLESQPELEGAANETAIHRLFSDKVDFQSLKDIHLAIDSATQYIMVFIIRDFIGKCDANAAARDEPARNERKRFQARDAEDDEQRELGPHDTTRHTMSEAPESTAAGRRTRTRTGVRAAARVAAARVAATRVAAGPTPRKRPAARTIETSLEFAHLLKHCESKFILRRSTALRDHLGELKDHKIVSEDDSGNIQCLVEVGTCRRFIEWVESSGAE